MSPEVRGLLIALSCMRRSHDCSPSGLTGQPGFGCW